MKLFLTVLSCVVRKWRWCCCPAKYRSAFGKAEGRLKRRTKNSFPLLLCIVLFSISLPSLYSAPRSAISIGVLAVRGPAQAIATWGPLAEYLSRKIPGYEFRIVPLDHNTITSAVEKGEVQFVITNPGSYTTLEMQSGVTRIATRVNLYGDSECDKLGAVIFTRAGRHDIRGLKDLKGKTFMSAHEQALTWWVAEKELMDHGINPHRHLAGIRFVDFPHDNVVYGVKSGAADAGVVWAGVLEQMAAAGRIDIREFSILNDRKGAAFPLHVTTRLYPEWPFARTRHVSELLSRQVAIALYQMKKSDPAARSAGIAGWTTPLTYEPVHALMKELRAGGYRDYGRITLQCVIARYRWWIILSSGLFTLAFVMTALSFGLNRKLKTSNRELNAGNALLESRVAERTLELQLFNRSLEEEISEKEAAEAEVLRINRELAETNELLKVAILELKAMNEEYEATNEALVISEQDLMVSEEKYRTLIQGAGEAISVIQDDIIVFANRNTEKITGFTPEEMVSKNISVFIHPDDRELMTEYRRRRINGEEVPDVYSFRGIDKNGNTRIIERHVALIAWEGRPACLAFDSDISERIHAEEALRESEEKYRHLVENLRMGVIVHGPDSGILMSNAYAAECLGLTREQMAGMTAVGSGWRYIFEGGSKLELENYPVNMVMSTGEPLYDFLMRIVRPVTGDIVFVLVNAFPEFDSSGALRHVVVTFADVTELNLLKEELVESRESYRSMVENINDVLCEINMNGVYDYVSPVCKNLLGYDPDELVGEKTGVIIHPEDFNLAKQRYRELTDDRSSLRDVWRFRDKEGRWRWMDCASTLVRKNSGESTVIVIARDITERRVIEESLVLSEKKYKSLTERMSDILWTTDMELRTNYVSPSVERVLGFTQEERLRQKLDEMLTPESLARAYDILARELAMEAPGSDPDRTVVMELDFYRKDGTIAVIECTVSAIRNGEGKMIGLQGLSREITARKILEEEAKINENRINCLFKLSQQKYESEGDVLRLALESVSGLSSSSLAGLYSYDSELMMFTSWMFFDGNGAENMIEQAQFLRSPEISGVWGRPVLEKTPVVINTVVNDAMLAGRARVTRFMAVPVFFEGEIVAVAGVANKEKEYTPFDVQQLAQMMDSVWKIVENKRAERALRESEQRFRQIAESSFEGIIIHDEGTILDGNSVLAVMFGVRLEEIYGQNVFTYIEEGYRDRVVKNLRGGYERPLELMVRKKNGLTFPVETIGKNIIYNGKNVRVAAIRDITERKKAESELIKLASVVRYSSECISMADPDGHIIFVNDAGAEMMGIYPNEFGTVSVIEVLSDFSKTILRSEVVPDLFSRGFWSGELQYINRKNGRRSDVYATTFAIKDQDTGALLYLANVSLDITERKRAESELHESESRYRSLFEESSVSIWEEDFSSVCAYFNELRTAGVSDFRNFFENRPDAVFYCADLVKVLAINRETARQFCINDTGPRDGLVGSFIKGSFSVFREELIALAEGKTYFKTETPVLKENGELAQMILYLSVVSGHEKDLGRVHVSFVDITERKIAEEELEKYRARLEDMVIDRTRELEYAIRKNELILNSAGEGIYGIDMAGRITFINPAAATMVKWSQNELVGKVAHVLLHHTRQDGSPHMIEDCLIYRAFIDNKQYHVHEDVLWRKDGSSFIVEYTSTPISEYGEAVGAVVVFRDITERKMAEKTLADERNLMKTLIDSVPDQIYAKDRFGKFILANSKVVNALGRESVYDVLWKTDYDFFPEMKADKSFEEEQRILNEGIPLINKEESVALADVGMRWYSINKVPLRDSNGGVIGIVGINRDITDTINAGKILQEAKEAAEAANRAKSTFLSSMSHEIRTPMNAILGFTQFMMRDPDVTPLQMERLNTINRSGEHLLSLINDILEISKIEAGKVVINRAGFDLHSLLRDIDMMFRIRADAKGLNLVIEWSDALPRFIKSDEGKLRQILINLMGNAVKFTHEGGIILRAMMEEAEEAGGSIIIEVEDSGIGIDDNDVEKIFHVFEQTEAGMRAGGTGLGLAISVYYARLLGGDIRVKSEVGKGSCFTMRVPVESGEEMKTRVIQPKRFATKLKPGQKPYRVLVVDDKEDNRAFLVELLECAGFSVEESVDGLDAIKKFTAWSPDIILMDLNMPVMNGYESIIRIREMEKGGDLPIIAVTASAFEEDRQKVFEINANGYLRKPFKAEELYEILKEHLNVEYCYEDGPQDEKPDSRHDIQAELAKLPDELNLRMLEAAINLDQDLLAELVGNAEPLSPHVRGKITGLVNRYQFDLLINLLKRGSYGPEQ